VESKRVTTAQDPSLKKQGLSLEKSNQKRSVRESLQVRTQACRSKSYHLARATKGERRRVTTG
jgi:hypothetical protein